MSNEDEDQLVGAGWLNDMQGHSQAVTGIDGTDHECVFACFRLVAQVAIRDAVCAQAPLPAAAPSCQITAADPGSYEHGASTVSPHAQHVPLRAAALQARDGNEIVC